MKQWLSVFVGLVILAQVGWAQNPDRARRMAVRDSIIAARAPMPASQAVAPVAPASVVATAETAVNALPVAVDSIPIDDAVILESLNVRDTEIRDLLQGFAVQYNLNLLLAANVKGPVSVNFSKIQLKKALRSLLDENGYELEVDGKTMKVRKARPKAPESKAPVQRFVVDYRNGKLSLDLDQIPLDQLVRKLVEVTGANIIADAGSTVPVTLLVREMELAKAMRMLAETNRLSARQVDGVWRIGKDQQGPSESGSPGRTWVKVSDGLVTIEANDAQLQAVLVELTEQAGVGSVFYGKLTGTVTAHISRVTLDEALKYLFRGTAFTFWKQNDIWFIGPHDMQTGNNSSLITLKHMKAEEVLRLLPPSLTKDVQIQVVKSQNSLMALGTYDNLDAIREYVDKMDLPIPQILVEALVLDVDIEKARSYGMNLFMGSAAKSKGKESIYPGIDQTLNKGQAENALGKIGLDQVISLPKDFVARIQAMEQEKILKVKARSQIATLNGETAVLTIGQTQYFLLKSETDFNQGTSVTNKTSERFEKVEANATLTVTPYVTGKGEVTCEIVPDFSEPEGSFNSNVPPTLNKRYVKASVRLRQGETIVLGGMVKESTNDVHTQMPFLGSIPILGWLFKNVDHVKSRSQLLIYVTPTIYYGSEGKVDLEKELKKAAE